MLKVLVEAERCAVRTYTEICNMTFGKDHRTYDLALPFCMRKSSMRHGFPSICPKVRPATSAVANPASHLTCADSCQPTSATDGSVGSWDFATSPGWKTFRPGRPSISIWTLDQWCWRMSPARSSRSRVFAPIRKIHSTGPHSSTILSTARGTTSNTTYVLAGTTSPVMSFPQTYRAPRPSSPRSRPMQWKYAMMKSG